jgi:Zn-dependent peptidase ImmA (M78 family)
VPQAASFASLSDFAGWTQNYGGRKYTIEQEANEFAGRLLVPESRLRICFDEFAPQMERLLPNFVASGQVRDNFAQRIAPRFGVNSQVIAIRLDRDSLWPAS